jgi:GT2 family glycosyltransferase
MLNIAIGLTSYGTTTTPTTTSLVGMVLSDKKQRNLINNYIEVTGPTVAGSRNVVVEEFLKTENDWLFFVDGDMGIYLSDLYRLYDTAINNNLKIITATYFSYDRKSKKSFPVAFVKNKNGTNQPADISGLRDLDFFEIEFCGAGALLIHRSVLEKTSQTVFEKRVWFYDIDLKTNKRVGEDYFFCQRAKEMGEKVYISPKVLVDHYKMVPINKDHYLDTINPR